MTHCALVVAASVICLHIQVVDAIGERPCPSTLIQLQPSLKRSLFVDRFRQSQPRVREKECDSSNNTTTNSLTVNRSYPENVFWECRPTGAVQLLYERFVWGCPILACILSYWSFPWISRNFYNSMQRASHSTWIPNTNHAMDLQTNIVVRESFCCAFDS